MGIEAPRQSYQDIEKILDRFRNCIETGAFHVSDNRPKNQALLTTYSLKKQERIKILLSITANETSKIEYDEKDNTKLAYQFRVSRRLRNLHGETEQVIIYVKFEFEEKRNKDEYVVVISFHEAEWSMPLYFNRNQR